MDLKKLEIIIVDILNQHQLSLYSLKTKKEFGEMVLEILVDGSDLSSDHLGLVNGVLSAALTEDVFDPNYYLEVSSPGAERPLRNAVEVEKAIGKYVHIETPELNSDGYLLDFKDGIITFQINLKGRLKKLEIPYTTVKSMRLAIKF
jgi:ribosome maturation factor RimP